MTKLYHYSNKNGLTVIKANPLACFSIHPNSHDFYGVHCYIVDFKGFPGGGNQYNMIHAEETISRYDNNEFINEEDLEVCFDYDIKIDEQIK